jgi:hypothetical protein
MKTKKNPEFSSFYLWRALINHGRWEEGGLIDVSTQCKPTKIDDRQHSATLTSLAMYSRIPAGSWVQSLNLLYIAENLWWTGRACYSQNYSYCSQEKDLSTYKLDRIIWNKRRLLVFLTIHLLSLAITNSLNIIKLDTSRGTWHLWLTAS